MNILLKQLLKEAKEENKTLFKNDWISLMSVLDQDGTPYIYSHESRCNGNIVAVLLYERIGKDGWKYGLRSEKTPCWGSEAQLSSLTGGVNKGSNPEDTAVKELKEEAGLIVKKEDLKSLGTCRGTKSSDTTYHLYALDCSGLKKTTPTGDDEGKIVWIQDTTAFRKVVDPIWSTMFMRLGYN